MNSMTGKADTLYVWFDTEYSTLELEDACLLQVAALVTNSKLKRVLPPEQDVRLAIRLPESEKISPWVEEHLPDLVKACRSAEAVDIAEADDRLSSYINAALNSLPERREERPILAGNSIHMDWRLTCRFLPKFSQLLHYRLLDVTAFKLEWKRRRRKREFDKEDPANILKYFPQANLSVAGIPHDAYYDLQASIAELAFYRQYLFR